MSEVINRQSQQTQALGNISSKLKGGIQKAGQFLGNIKEDLRVGHQENIEEILAFGEKAVQISQSVSKATKSLYEAMQTEEGRTAMAQLGVAIGTTSTGQRTAGAVLGQQFLDKQESDRQFKLQKTQADSQNTLATAQAGLIDVQADQVVQNMDLTNEEKAPDQINAEANRQSVLIRQQLADAQGQVTPQSILTAQIQIRTFGFELADAARRQILSQDLIRVTNPETGETVSRVPSATDADALALQVYSDYMNTMISTLPEIFKKDKDKNENIETESEVPKTDPGTILGPVETGTAQSIIGSLYPDSEAAKSIQKQEAAEQARLEKFRSRVKMGKSSKTSSAGTGGFGVTLPVELPPELEGRGSKEAPIELYADPDSNKVSKHMQVIVEYAKIPEAQGKYVDINGILFIISDKELKRIENE